MKKFKQGIAMLLLCALAAGCGGRSQELPAPVTAVPAWVEPTAPPGSDALPQLRIHLDLTQSMFGFAGSGSSPIARTIRALTDEARFNSRCSTFLLEPDEGKDLYWESCDPLLMNAAILDRDKTSYTTSGDFDEGGPLNSVFCAEADPEAVQVLITDLLEQEGQLEPLIRYVTDLFAADTHQQLALYAADSPFDGFVSYATIEQERFVIRGTAYTGQRPFLIIAAGPAAGIAELDAILDTSGVSFSKFLVENRRTPAQAVVFTPNASLAREILVEDPALARCTLDLAPMAGLAGFAYRYEKVSANKASTARLSLLAETGHPSLALEDVRWYSWQPQESPEAAEDTQATDGTEVPSQVIWIWQPCDPPEGVTLSLSPIGAGPAIPGRTPEESGLEDLAPGNDTLYELSVLLDESAAGKAWAVQAGVTIPAAANPACSTDSFRRWDISFSDFGLAARTAATARALAQTEADKAAAQADMDAVFTRIPDLCLLLEALAKLDCGTATQSVAQIRIIVQNYETQKEE